MDLNGIDVFVKVVQTGSFSQAARLLNMPNTTVSAKVAALEKRLGTTLIRRTTRKLNVTEAGQAYYAHCVRALEEIQTGESELATGAKEPHGLLRLTASIDMGHSLLPRLVCAYLQRYPRMQVELIISNRVVDLVGEGVDLALRAAQLEDSSLIAKKFISAGMGFWASPRYLKELGTPKHPRDLDKRECLIHSDFQNIDFELKRGRELFTVRPKGRLVADDFQTLLHFAELGNGIGFFPDFMCRENEMGKKLVRLFPEWKLWENSRLSLVYPAQKFVSPKVQAFIALAEETLKGEA
jgi:DNA-binding transcriptional LysR family regulator